MDPEYIRCMIEIWDEKNNDELYDSFYAICENDIEFVNWIKDYEDYIEKTLSYEDYDEYDIIP